jgi:hypothetical protein
VEAISTSLRFNSIDAPLANRPLALRHPGDGAGSLRQNPDLFPRKGERLSAAGLDEQGRDQAGFGGFAANPKNPLELAQIV